MNLLAYWGVFKSQRLIVVLGVTVTLALAAFSFVSVSPSGVTLRSPRVYMANSTLFLKQAIPSGKKADAAPYETGQLEYLAGIYARLASGDQLRRMVDPTRKQVLSYQVGTLRGDTGDPLPMLSVSGFGPTRSGAAALSVRVGRALQKYILADQNRTSTRIDVPMVVRPRAANATVFQGVRLTRPLMLTVLGLAVTIFIAFTRYNLQINRARPEADSLAAVVPTARSPIEVAEESLSPVSRVDEATARRSNRSPVSDEARTTYPPVRGGTLRSPNALPTSSAPGSEQRSVAAEQ